MSDLVLYLGITAVGFILGTRLRNYKSKLRWTGMVQTVSIGILVLAMGARMGSNAEITENLDTIGIAALVMTIFIMAGSVLVTRLFRVLMGIDKYGRFIGRSRKKASAPAENPSAEDTPSAETAVCEAISEVPGEKQKIRFGGFNTMTIVILIAVVAGMMAGYLIVRPAYGDNIAEFDALASLCIKIGLCVLLIFVGLDLGLDESVVGNFKKVGLRVLAFPIATMIGTLSGAFLAGLLLQLSAKESLAIGAGFGWYSLAPGVIMDAGYLTASAISFLHNVMRELFSMILVPVLAPIVGYIEVTSIPGSPAMDVCLPIVEKSTRSDIAVYSFVSGVVLSTLVPILVPLIVA